MACFLLMPIHDNAWMEGDEHAWVQQCFIRRCFNHWWTDFIQHQSSIYSCNLVLLVVNTITLLCQAIQSWSLRGCFSYAWCNALDNMHRRVHNIPPLSKWMHFNFVPIYLSKEIWNALKTSNIWYIVFKVRTQKLYRMIIIKVECTTYWLRL